MRRFSSALVIASVTAVVVASPAPARADDPKVKAFEHFQLGLDLYEAKQYARAYDEFIGAQAIHAEPIFIYWAAQSQQQLGNFEHAASLFERYLGLDPNAVNRPQAEQKLKDCRDRLARGAAAPPPNPPVAVAPAPGYAQPGSPPTQGYTPPPAGYTPPPPGAPPAPPPGEPPPGYAPGPPPAGQEAGLVQTAPAPGQDGSKPITRRWWFWTAIGVVVVAGVVGGIVASTPKTAGVPPTDFGNHTVNW